MVLTAYVCLAGSLQAQTQRSVLMLKRGALTPPVGGCPALPALPDPSEVSDEARARAASLAGSARQSAIIGDEAGAHSLLEQAFLLDPLEGSVAYLLARSFEQQGNEERALIQYCEYLRIEKDAPDAESVRARVAELAPPPESPIPEPALTSYRNGLAQYELGRFDQAVAAFTQAVRSDPDFGEAYYNRGVAYAAQEQHMQAAQSLERYLEVTPQAEDSANVVRWVNVLRTPMARYSPRAALTAGLIVPGGGHFYTRRPTLGLAFLAGAVGAVAYGYYSEEIEILCNVTPTNGECPPNEVHSEVRNRPYLNASLAVAGAIAVFAAVDAYRGARRRNQLARSVIRVEGADGQSALRVGVPAPLAVGGALGIEWLRLTF